MEKKKEEGCDMAGAEGETGKSESGRERRGRDTEREREMPFQ